jgi:hypothetical protein
VVGTLGAVEGPDKGLRYLLAAWKKLNYKKGGIPPFYFFLFEKLSYLCKFNYTKNI